MKYLGEYELQIENGKAAFPWVENADIKRVWIAFESMGDCKMESSYIIINSENVGGFMSEMKKSGQNFKILGQGEVLLDSEKMWDIPEIILEYLKTDEIFLCGAGTHIQIISSDDRKRYEWSEDEMEEFMELLKELDL